MRSIDLYSLANRRRLRRAASRSRVQRRAGRFGLGLLAALLLSLAAGITAVSVGYSRLTHDLPSVESLPAFFNPGDGLFFQPTRLYDRTGQQLLLTLENPGIPRRYLSVDPAAADTFSPELVRAAVGLLDPTFWNHPGFLSNRLLDPQPATIAEKLAYDLFLSQEPADTRRAMRMHLLAAELVSRYGRSKVLEWYLNSAYFGHLAYGAEAAARLYLDKSASELTLAEAALLVPLTTAPALNPLDSPNAAVERQRSALEDLLAQSAITQAEFERSSEAPLRLSTDRPSPHSSAGAFTMLALDQLTRLYGRQRLERGGLRIITSLDVSLQLEMTCLVRTQLRRLEGNPGQESLPDGSACQSARLLPTLPIGQPLPDDLQASGVLIDNQTGQVLALLGDTSLQRESSVLSAHTPGSLLSPFVALAAFARSYSPASLVWDIPGVLPEGFPEVSNPDGSFHGPLRLRLALANDYLIPVSQVARQIGPDNAWRLAAAMGLSRLANERSDEILFQGGGVSVVELAQAYAVIARLGVSTGQRLAGSGALEPITTLYVEDANGHLLLDNTQPTSQAVLSQPLAYLAHHVLSDEQARWATLGFPNPLEVGRPAGAKVGRDASGKEAWAAGYLPQRTAVFWLGWPAGSRSTNPRIDPRFAAGMWHALIQHTASELDVEDWQAPAGISFVQVCDPSGQLPTADCPARVREVFLNGNEPVSYDSLYRAYQVNRETGRLATVFTPSGLVDERVYLVVPPEAREWARSAGIETPPEVYDTIQPPAPSPEVQIVDPASFAYVRGVVRLRGSAGGEGFSYFRVQAGAGLNPQSWLQVGPDNNRSVSNGLLAEWDTQGLDGLYAVRLLVVRSDQSIENATIQVTVDNTPPQARVIYPLPQQEFDLPGDREITFQAETSDAVGVSLVEWLVDGKVVGQNLVAPFSFTWRATTGAHALAVRAHDLAGNVTQSSQIEFNVTP